MSVRYDPDQHRYRHVLSVGHVGATSVPTSVGGRQTSVPMLGPMSWGCPDAATDITVGQPMSVLMWRPTDVGGGGLADVGTDFGPPSSNIGADVGREVM